MLPRGERVAEGAQHNYPCERIVGLAAWRLLPNLYQQRSGVSRVDSGKIRERAFSGGK